MKTCLICQAPCEDDAASTCPLCGEGSWSEVVSAKAPKGDKKVDEQPADEAETPKADKKSRR